MVSGNERLNDVSENVPDDSVWYSAHENVANPKSETKWSDEACNREHWKDIPVTLPSPSITSKASATSRAALEWLLLLVALAVSVHLWILLLSADGVCEAPTMDPAAAFFDLSANSSNIV